MSWILLGAGGFLIGGFDNIFIEIVGIILLTIGNNIED